MAKLIFIDQRFAGRVYELVLEKTTVGRDDQNTLTIRDRSLSARHCEILTYGPEVIVRDLNSRNGTFVQGVRLNQQSQVKSGQTVRFGSVEARLELGPEPQTSDGTEETAVYAHARVMREQRRAQRQPKLETASMQLEPDEPAGSDEQTVMLAKVTLPEAAPESSAQPTIERRRQRPSAAQLALIAAAVALAVGILIWLL